jgi:hypothetical protein
LLMVAQRELPAGLLPQEALLEVFALLPVAA